MCDLLFSVQASPVTFRIDCFWCDFLPPYIYDLCHIIYLKQRVLILTKYRSFPRIAKHRKTHLRTDSYDCYCVRILGFRQDKRTSKFRPFSGGSFSLTQLGARTITLSAIQYNLVVDCLKWSCAAWLEQKAPTLWQFIDHWKAWKFSLGQTTMETWWRTFSAFDIRVDFPWCPWYKNLDFSHDFPVSFAKSYMFSPSKEPSKKCGACPAGATVKNLAGEEVPWMGRSTTNFIGKPDIIFVVVGL